MSRMSTLALLAIISLASVINGAIERPRGVPPASASQYQPNRNNKFTCLSNGVEINFEFVNDDYCDCEDGSDEPGTAACPNMKFFCLNKGHTPEDILSSRVNDGICDCCDGSDEYLKDKIQCSNTCDELGRKRREELIRERELRESGVKIKNEYMQEGRQEREKNQALVEELEKSKETLGVEREEFERQKTDAESPEKEAKEKHEKAWEAVKAEKQAAKDKQKAVQAFQQLDANGDNLIDAGEMMTHTEFDIDSDGSVSEEEAKEYLEDLEHAAESDFIEKIWPNIKEIYKAPEPPVPAEAPPVEDNAVNPPGISPDIQQVPPILEGGAPDEYDEDDDEGDIEDDDDEDDDDHHHYRKAEEGKKEEPEEEDKMPEYDDETKKLIEAADEARRLYDEADKKVKDVESQIHTAQKFLEKDFGPDHEFAFLYNKCFEYTEREYTYKLCPFEKASQRPKSGGSETSLGVWGHWDGPSNDKYAAQKYEKGQNCWNGPDRSVRIILRCGTANELLSASEPSRCEYQFDFATPARCTTPTAEEYRSIDHDEL